MQVSMIIQLFKLLRRNMGNEKSAVKSHVDMRILYVTFNSRKYNRFI